MRSERDMEKLSAAIIICCLHILHCKGVAVNLGNTIDFYGLKGQSVLMQCVLTSGNFDASESRRWFADTVILLSNGFSSNEGSGFTESFGNDRFGLTTPTLDNSYNGTNYRCTYGFQQAYLYLRIAEIEGISQSSGKCIDKKSIGTCSFSLSKVIPEISSSNLTVSYKDGTMEEITSMLNTTSQMNPDGTYAYQFTMLSTSLSSDVKSISLSVMVDVYSKTFTITMVTVEEDQSSEDLKIVAGVLGGLVGVGIIAVAIYLFYRCKYRSQDGQGQDNNGDNSNNTSSTATKAPIGRTRESQNNTGSNTTKNATERVGSPASTSNIELSAKNKAGVPKGEQSALKQKEINTPLPSPPSQPPTAFAHNLPLSRTNQLPPLAKENEEANTTEKKKKKKKKRRKKSEEAGENVDKIQDDDNDN